MAVRRVCEETVEKRSSERAFFPIGRPSEEASPCQRMERKSVHPPLVPGARIEVWWADDRKWYGATVQKVVGEHVKVAYDDGDTKGTLLVLVREQGPRLKSCVETRRPHSLSSVAREDSARAAAEDAGQGQG